ncbi:SPW repeat protein [Haladaptatus sp. CMAA 1911]|uniref:SPW repeat protein n=1 Tax=unclassified Haladaptatus TaxID=2622732 RepID=UPI003753F4B9
MSSNTQSAPSRWASGANVLLGLWLFFIPTFVWSANGWAFWNDIIVGAAITILGTFSAYNAMNGGSTQQGSSGLNTLLGLWMIVSAFIWGSTALLFWNDIVVGVIVAILAGYAAFSASSGEAASGETSSAERTTNNPTPDDR